jgi:hypothetical protein
MPTMSDESTHNGGINIDGNAHIDGDAVGGDKNTTFNQQNQIVGTQINVGGNYYTSATPPPSYSPLHQLRTPLPDFTGRAAEVQRLAKGLRCST